MPKGHARSLIVAAAFGLVGVGAIVMYTRELRAEIAGGERVSVLVLAKAAKRGAPLGDEQLAERDVPIGYLDDRVVRASDRAKVLGVRLEHDLDPQQMLAWDDLALAGEGDRHLSQLVQPGTRALTLHIAANYMSIELLRPGDYVDVLGVVDEQRGAPQAVVLLQKVLVLAVGVETTPNRETHAGNRADQLLTIAVTLQQSQTIALAAQKGPVIAVLRSAEDPSVAAQIPVLSQVVARDPKPIASSGPTRPQKLGTTHE